jgi:uncharacterized protein YndB with AHSA1/START domain
MRVKKSINIKAPAERIWPYLTEPDKIMQWCITFRDFKYTSDQRAGVGIPVFIEEKAAGPVMQMDFSVIEWIENEVVAIRKVAGSMPKNYEQRWHIEAQNGENKFTFFEEIQMPWGFIGKLLESVGQGTSEKTVDEMLKKLKQLVEEEN